MNNHKLNDWTFVFDSAVRRFGCCFYKVKKISLSRKLVELNSVEQVKDVILHEIAHALAPSDAGHGLIWKKLATSVGAKCERTYDDKVITSPKKYKAVCSNGHIVFRHRMKRISCRNCSSIFDEKYLFKYELNKTN